jgi:N-carbamoyl-L-amino-acid hydrolase
MIHVNADRLLQDLTDLARIGAVPMEAGGGVDRRPFSWAERAARDFFRTRAEAAGVDVAVDAAANLSARLACGRSDARVILAGSHLDTVPHGGRYDGALGVLAALEALRVVKESGMMLPVDLEAIAFCDEEGRLGDLSGSQILTGSYSRASIEHFLAAAAEFPEDLAAMRAMIPGGLTVESLLAARRDLGNVAAYVELHIEQGPRLEHARIPIGVVSAIFGRRSYVVEFRGCSDHAGTTPMDLRRDALVAAARFIVGVNELARREFREAVATCGDVQVAPGVYNVVPNLARVLVEFRAADNAVLDAMDRRMQEEAEAAAAGAGVAATRTPTAHVTPRTMAGEVQAAICGACARMGLEYMALASGALHDAGSLAPFVPTGMIFVPSKGGKSHCPDEETEPADLVAGANVLLHTLLALAGQAAEQE